MVSRKHQRRQDRLERINSGFSGWYRWKNTSGSDIVLAHPLPGGRAMVYNGQEFEGDSRYVRESGLRMIADLSESVEKQDAEPETKEEVKPEPEPKQTVQEESEKKPELLIDTPQESELRFTESDGTPVETQADKKDEHVSNREKGVVDLQKSELVEFAKLKGVNVNPNWTKAKILEKIRET